VDLYYLLLSVFVIVCHLNNAFLKKLRFYEKYILSSNVFLGGVSNYQYVNLSFYLI